MNLFSSEYDALLVRRDALCSRKLKSVHCASQAYCKTGKTCLCLVSCFLPCRWCRCSLLPMWSEKTIKLLETHSITIKARVDIWLNDTVFPVNAAQSKTMRQLVQTRQNKRHEIDWLLTGILFTKICSIHAILYKRRLEPINSLLVRHSELFAVFLNVMANTRDHAV